MVRVQCKVCGDTGFTAAPNSIACKCGGRFKVIPENVRDEMFNRMRKLSVYLALRVL